MCVEAFCFKSPTMASKLLKAKFRGTDGSLGFKKGLNYNLEFQTNSSGDGSIQIRTTTKLVLVCAYGSVYSFFGNWTDIKPR